MLKVVIFDSGFGGDLFADYVEAELPTLDVIRLIDWRAEEIILKSVREARREAEKVLLPYIGKVDLIMFANSSLSFSSLRYFRHKYRNQKFAGFSLGDKSLINRRNSVFIMTTSAIAHSLPYRAKVRRFCPKVHSFAHDEWIPLISNGDLCETEIRRELLPAKRKFKPDHIILACSDFADIKPAIRNIFGRNVSIDDGFKTALRNICDELGIRGRSSYRKKAK